MPNASHSRSGAAYTNIQRLNDDLQIAQRADQRKGTWYLHRLGPKWIRRSLGTSDIREARAKAFEAHRLWYDDPAADWMAALGTSRLQVSFKHLAEDWLKTQTKDYDYKAAVVRKFLIPFFHNERNVSNVGAIDDALLDDYKVWRLNFWKQAPASALRSTKAGSKRSKHYGVPSATTLNRESPTLRQILNYAAKQGHFKNRPVPVLAVEIGKANPRPAFLGGDFDRLAAEAETWIAEASDGKHRQRRQLLADWIWVGRYTGIRLPHEADKLTWGDVRLDTKLLHIAENTKTGRRDVPLNDEAASRLTEMRGRRSKFLSRAKRKFNNAECVFVQEDGTPFRDLGGLFNELLERCNFPTRTDGAAYSPYSLRHTFATFALAEGMTGDHVAEIMGTSVKMLNTHYKHGTIEQTRRYLEEHRRALKVDAAHAAAPLTLDIVDIDELPQRDWRRKRLVLSPS